MSQIVVRVAGVGDAEGIGRCHVDAWRWAYRGIMPDGVLDRLDAESRSQHWAQVVEGDDEHVWVAYHGGNVVGFASAGPARDEEMGERVAELYTLYVLRPVQGTGVGRRLMNAVLQHWQSVKTTAAVLWVAADNLLGRRFYEAGGWALDGATGKHPVGSHEISVVRYRITI